MDQQTPGSASSSSKSRPRLLRNDTNETQDGNGGENQRIPPPNETEDGNGGENQRIPPPNETQNVTGGGNQRIPPPNPPPPRLAYRVLIIQNQSEIVGVLSALATRFGQAFYIGHGTGYVSQATFISLTERSSSGHQRLPNGGAKIIYMSGWFHPRLRNDGSNSGRVVPTRLDSGVLHVSLLHERVLQFVSLATGLIAFGPVEVDVLFVCGLGSTIQPVAAGGPRELYTIVAQPK